MIDKTLNKIVGIMLIFVLCFVFGLIFCKMGNEMALTYNFAVSLVVSPIVAKFFAIFNN